MKKIKYIFLFFLIFSIIYCLKNETNNADEMSIKYHVVERGETIFEISQRYGISIKEIKKANPILNEDFSNLTIGLKLVVSEDSVSSQSLKSEF